MTDLEKYTDAFRTQAAIAGRSEGPGQAVALLQLGLRLPGRAQRCTGAPGDDKTKHYGNQYHYATSQGQALAP